MVMYHNAVFQTRKLRIGKQNSLTRNCPTENVFAPRIEKNYGFTVLLVTDSFFGAL